MLNKKIVFSTVASLSLLAATNSIAGEPGVYLGAQAGYGDVHTFSKDSGLAGRLFAGYQFDTNWAAEMGWTKFTTATQNSTVTKLVPVNIGLVNVNVPVKLPVKQNVKTDAVDLVAKGILPVGNNFNLYGKAGVAYLLAREDVTTGRAHAHHNQNNVLPTFGVGATYDFTPNVAGDVSYNRIQKVGNSNVNSTDYVGVGLIYSIG
jgi:opacity protein-like surface antigen